MADVFISYSQRDRALIEPIVNGLTSLGFSVWFDDNLRTGPISYDKAIYEELSVAKAVLACWSPRSMESDWPRSEASFARDSSKLAACYVERCTLPPPFNLMQTEDLSGWGGDMSRAGWTRLVSGIGRLAGRPQIEELLHARNSGDEKKLYAFAQKYPDDLNAQNIWAQWAPRHQAAFAGALETVEAEAARAIDELRARLDAAIAGARTAFATWMEAERRGAAGPMPVPAPVLAAAPGGKEAQARADGLAATLTRERADLAELRARYEVAQKANERLTADLGAAKRAGGDASAIALAPDSLFTGARLGIIAGVALAAALLGGLGGRMLFPGASPDMSARIASLSDDLDRSKQEAAAAAAAAKGAADRAAKAEAGLAALTAQDQKTLEELAAAKTEEDKAKSALSASGSQTQTLAADLTTAKKAAADNAERASKAEAALDAAQKKNAELAKTAGRTAGEDVDADPRAKSCDELTADQSDPQKPKTVAAVPYEKIDAARAETACRAAVAAFPGSARLSYELARALDKANKGKEALLSYRTAAELGSVAAMGSIGWKYMKGYNGLDVNEVIALSWYRKAADGGDPFSTFEIGTFYGNALAGLKQDSFEARKWYQKGAELGWAQAMNFLAYMYHNGQGGDVDDVQANAWNQKSADLGNSQAMNDLGLAWLNGLGGFAQSNDKAFDWFKKAADLGLTAAKYNLGYMYQYGSAAMKDMTEAAKWYRRSAEENYALGMYKMGALYADGIGVNYDPSESGRWYVAALKAAQPDAQKLLVDNKGADVSLPVRKAIQTQLQAFGFYAGPIDGEFSPALLAALAAYVKPKS